MQLNLNYAKFFGLHVVQCCIFIVYWLFKIICGSGMVVCAVILAAGTVNIGCQGAHVAKVGIFTSFLNMEPQPL
jgi:hypothetical protein